MTNAFEDLLTKIKDPENMLTPEERDSMKTISRNAENIIKSSLINLLMGQFTKIAVFDKAMAQTIKLLSERASKMDDQDLINFLGALSKVSSVESKNVMDLFKKHDTDLKQFLAEVRKLATDGRPSAMDEEDSDVIIESGEKDKTLSRLSQEKKDRLIRLLEGYSK